MVMSAADVIAAMPPDERAGWAEWAAVHAPEAFEEVKLDLLRAERRVDAAGWRVRAPQIWPDRFASAFAPHHARLWDHTTMARPGDPVDPYALLLARGGGKSSTIESVVAYTGLHGLRTYWLYVCGTQEAADTHVEAIAELLEHPNVATMFPEHADKQLGKYGNSRGWRRNRLRTRGGLIVDAAGLNTKVRGLLVDQMRPDGIALDDIDEADDSPQVTAKRLKRLSSSILPAGRSDGSTLVLFGQNLVHGRSIAAQMVYGWEGTERILTSAVVDGPHPALLDAQWDADGELIGGTPTWEGQPLEACRQQIRLWGLPAWKREAQHEVQTTPGALWNPDDIAYETVEVTSQMVAGFARFGIGCDPKLKNRARTDEAGIIAGGIRPNGDVVIVGDWSGMMTAGEFGATVARIKAEWGGIVVVEDNAAGEHLESTMQIAGVTDVEYVTAVGSKADRAGPVAALYRPGGVRRVTHGRRLARLEAEQTSWVAGVSTWSPGRIDALVHLVRWLVPGLGGNVPVVDLRPSAADVEARMRGN